MDEKRLKSLIAEKKKELSNTPIFLDAEIDNLIMDIRALERGLERIKGGVNK